ncbi:winged helix-turn-helix domain-containing protein [Patescibacteria group bacterium]|nr:winged helix-turn-helix domain-containing protein [Patescibacteria group bacterium]
MEQFPKLNEKLKAGVHAEPKMGPLSLDLTTKTISIEGSTKQAALTSNEYQILWMLVRAQGDVISESDIIEFMYDDPNKDIPLYNPAEVFLHRLRKKLADITDQVTIETHRGHGYYLKVTS